MGKHNKRRNMGRAALVVGAAPLALLIANGTASAAEVGTVNPLGVPVGSVDTTFDSHSTQTPTGQSSTATGTVKRTTTIGKTTDTTASTVSGTVGQDRTVNVDPKAGTAEVAQKVNGSGNVGATHTVSSELPGGGKVSTGQTGNLAGGAEGSATTAVDRGGNVVSGSKGNYALSGSHNFNASGNYGPGKGSLTTAQSSTGAVAQSHNVGLSPTSGVITAADLQAARAVQNAYSASYTAGPMTLTSAEQQSLAADGGLVHASAVTPTGQNSTTNAARASLAAAQSSTRGIAFGDMFAVTHSTTTAAQVGGSMTVGEKNGQLSKPEHTMEYKFAHSDNVHVQVGPKSYDRGVDVTLPPLKITPHQS